MRPFSNKLRSDGTVTFLPCSPGQSPAYGPTVAYPPVGSGAVVRANVQPYKVLVETTDGIRRYTTEYVVTLLDDPATLNGGLGCRRDDAFAWSAIAPARYLIAQGDPDPLRTVWKVRCVAFE